MNSTADSGGLFNNIGGFGYGIGVSIGILLLITTITLASYFCTRTDVQRMAPATQRTLPQHPIETHDYVVNVGLDEATILSYPKLLYSEAKLKKTDSTATCCSICLADYKSTDMLRLLPDCGHLFHLKCVDPWLRLNPTCPVCRTSPLPTPLSTPLAEVVPLASRRDWYLVATMRGDCSIAILVYLQIATWLLFWYIMIFFFFLVALDLILYHIVIKSCVAKSRNLCIWSRNEFLCVFYLEQEW